MKRVLSVCIGLFAVGASTRAHAAYETIVSPATPEANLGFGESVALDGARLLVTDARGLTFFEASVSGTWTQTGTVPYTGLGNAAATLRGDWAIVSIPAAGVVSFHRSAGTWSVATTLGDLDWFGFDGTTLASPRTSVIRVYTAGTSALTAEPDIAVPAGIGRAAAVSGSTIVASEQLSGVQVFVKSGTTWTKQATIATPSTVFLGQMALAGNRLVLGYPEDNAVRSGAGSVTIHERTGATWTKTATLYPPDAVLQGRFGNVVSVAGDRLLVAATDAGRFYLYRRVGTEWKLDAGAQSRIGVTAPTVTIPSFGGASLSSSWVAIGTPKQAVGTLADAGAVFTYPTTCAADDGCAPTRHCASTVCVAPLANGVACDRARQCGSGFCVDGVCCDQACDGQCEACDVTGKAGACLPVTDAPHGKRAACPSTGTCGVQKCDGSLRGACGGYVGAEVSCREKICADGVERSAAVCDGKGSCPVSVEHSCDGFTCDGAACRTSCGSALDCSSGYTCRDAKCITVTELCGEGGATVVRRDGTSSDCAPYACRAGACLADCTATNDCAPGFLCNGERRCVTREEALPAEEESGCALGRQSARSTLSLGLAAMLGAAVRRRRRS